MRIKTAKKQQEGICDQAQCKQPSVATNGTNEFCQRHADEHNKETALATTAVETGVQVIDGGTLLDPIEVSPTYGDLQSPPAAQLRAEVAALTTAQAGPSPTQRQAVAALAQATSPIELPTPEVVVRVPEQTPRAVALVSEAAILREDLATVLTFAVATAEDAAFANDELKGVKKLWKERDAERREATEPMNAALKVVNGWFKPSLDLLASLEKTWKDKLAAWTLAEQSRRQALELQAFQAAEASRLEAEALRENAREVAAAGGHVEAFELAQEAASIEAAGVEAARTALVQAAEVPQAPAGFSLVDKWVFVVEDPDALPREYLAPDLDKIGGVVAALKGSTKIPGVRVYNDPIKVSR